MTDNNNAAATAATDKADEELSNLLDNALEDFIATKACASNDGKDTSQTSANFSAIISQTVQGLQDVTANVQQQSTATAATTVVIDTDVKKTGETAAAAAPPADILPQLNAEFFQQMAQQFEAGLLAGGGAPDDLLTVGGEGATPSLLTSDQIQQQLEQMAAAAQQAIDNPNVSDESVNFASIISQTIQGLNEGTDSLQNNSTSGGVNAAAAADDPTAMLMNMFGGGGGGVADTDNPFLPVMQGMMQSLLSKDVLYPSLKDILDRFPQWIADNRQTLSVTDKERYENQCTLMHQVCDELEGETATDSAERKQKRFEKVLELMQQLQNYGQPPTELVGEMPALPAPDPNQCCLM